MKKFIVLIVILSVSLMLKGQRVPDTLNKAKINKNLLIASSVFAYGSMVSADWCFLKDKSVNNYYRKQLPDFRTHLDDYLIIAPSIVPYLSPLWGHKSQHGFGPKSILLIGSYAIEITMSEILKRSVKKIRPNGENKLSFPSGHTGFAFASAHFVHKELGNRHWGYSVGAYLVAASVANFRLMNNKHWLSDVIAGAGVGIASTELAYLWLENRLNMNTFAFIPSYNSVQLIFLIR